MPQAIRINQRGKVVASERAVSVSKSWGEDVLWVATGGGGPWTITFGKTSSEPSTYPVKPGSPFSKSTYTIVKGGSGGSTGGPKYGAVGNTYRYKVKDADGNVTDDPDIDIES